MESDNLDELLDNLTLTDLYKFAKIGIITYQIIKDKKSSF